jgi:hypothetical protein
MTLIKNPYYQATCVNHESDNVHSSINGSFYMAIGGYVTVVPVFTFNSSSGAIGEQLYLELTQKPIQFNINSYIPHNII